MKFNYNRRVRNPSVRHIQVILDSGLAETVTYKRAVDQGENPPPGGTNPSYDNYSITVVKSNTALESQGSSTVVAAIGFEVGEQFFITRYDELPRDPYSKKIMNDYIVVNESQRQIKKAIPVFDVLVRIRV